MRFRTCLFKCTATLLLCVFGHLSAGGEPSWAAMISTDQAARMTDTQAQRFRLNTLLQREEVRGRLESWGVSAERAAAAVNSLTDREIAAAAEYMDRLPAGSDALGTIIGAILIVFIVLLVTDILGLTDVFPFVVKKR